MCIYIYSHTHTLLSQPGSLEMFSHLFLGKIYIFFMGDFKSRVRKGARVHLIHKVSKFPPAIPKSHFASEITPLTGVLIK